MAEKPEAVAEQRTALSASVLAEYLAREGAAKQVRVLSEYLTAEQLAEALGLSLDTLRRWESKRIGPPRVKIGSTILFRIGAVQEWLLGQVTVPVGARRRN